MLFLVFLNNIKRHFIYFPLDHKLICISNPVNAEYITGEGNEMQKEGWGSEVLKMTDRRAVLQYFILNLNNPSMLR